MIQIELTENEAATLREALEMTVSELGMEIADTDRQDFRSSLKEKKQLILGLLDRLPAGNA